MKEQRSLRGKIWAQPFLETDKNALQATVFAHRIGGAEPEAWLCPHWENLEDPMRLKDIELAVASIRSALTHHERIMVYGDFDADGITSTVALVHGLQRLGGMVSYRIPDRVNDSHGLKKSLLDEIAQTGTKLLITVDCGVNDREEARYAKSLGLNIIITDHHQVDPTRAVNEAVAVINPVQAECAYPHKNLAGVGVVFKLLQALNSDKDWLAPYAALVAIGTIADCVAIQGETRTLVQLGLQELNKGHWPGVMALLDRPTEINAETIGFQLAPCLNAASRLGQVQQAVQLFLGDVDRQAEHVTYLKQLNEERRILSRTFSAQARALVQPNQSVQIIFLETCPVGVLGLVASHLVEALAQPVLILTRHPHGALHGSARAPEGGNLAAALAAVAQRLIAFGGHAGAAGFQLEETQLPDFIADIQAWYSARKQAFPVLNIEGFVQPEWLSTHWLDWEKQMEPFGVGHQKPIWRLPALKLSDLKLIGKEQTHARLTFAEKYEVVAFFVTDLLPHLHVGLHYELAVKLSENNWNGEVSVQWQLVDAYETKDFLSI